MTGRRRLGALVVAILASLVTAGHIGPGARTQGETDEIGTGQLRGPRTWSRLGSGAVHDTWAVRDLPVLDATVGLIEQSYMVTVTDIAARTGLDPAQVARSLEALDPVYVDFRKTTTGGYVFKVTPEARRAVGQWPTAESLISALADQLYAASHLETGDERQSLLAYAARLIGDTLRDLAVDAAAQVLAPALDDVRLPEPEPLPAPDVPATKPVAGEEAGRSAGSGQPADPAAPKSELARSGLAKPEVAEPGVAKPEATRSGVAKPEAAESGVGQPGVAQPETAEPDLVPLPEPASFPSSLAARRTMAHRSSSGWPTGATTVTDTAFADTDQNPAQPPGDAANAS